MAGGSCATLLTDLANIFSTLKPCGAVVENSVAGAGMAGTLTVKFATSVALTSTARIEITFPTQRDGYAFNFPPGKVSYLDAALVQYGTQKTQYAHGTGTPLLDFTAVNVARITLGGFGSPTVADSEGGWQFTITNVRNPYVNNGLAAGTIGMRLLTSAGAVLDAVNITAPVFQVGDLRKYNNTISQSPCPPCTSHPSVCLPSCPASL